MYFVLFKYMSVHFIYMVVELCYFVRLHPIALISLCLHNNNKESRIFSFKPQSCV